MNNCTRYESSQECHIGHTEELPFPTRGGPPVLTFSIFGCWNSMCLSGKADVLDFEIPDKVKNARTVLNSLVERAEKTGIISPELQEYLHSLYQVETNTYGEKSVADALAQYSQTHHLDAIVLAGDNVYEMLQVQKQDRERWALEQLKKYLQNPKGFPSPGEFYRIQEALEKGFDQCFQNVRADRFLVAIGNHDVTDCSILNTELSHDKRFFFPAPYYDVVYGDFAHLVMIDTNMYSFKWKEEEDGKRKQKFQKHCDQTAYSDKAREAQANWVLNRIKQVQARWTILIGHIPLLAQGHKKKTPLIDSVVLDQYIFKPIEEAKLRVQFYFAADEHNQQFLYSAKRHLSMIVAGSGGAKLDDIYQKGGILPEYKFGESKHGFSTLSLTSEVAMVSFWEVDSFHSSRAKQVKTFLVDLKGNLLS